jgi:AcrR family transcriptional regulator
VISQSEKGDKQTEILAAALKLFVESGFHGTPTSKIAKEAGVANGTLFHYYKTKDDLIVALYIDIKTRLAGCMHPDPKKGETTKTRAKRNFIEVMDWALENEIEFKFVQQFLSSPYLLLITPEEIQKQSKAWLVIIEEGIASKEVKPFNTDYIFVLLSSNLYGLHQYLMTAKLPAKEQKELIASTFDLVWGMIEA